MRKEHGLEVMSSKINVIDNSVEQSLKRPRYESTADDPKRFKSSHIDMELSDGEEEEAQPEIIEISAPDGADDDIQEVGMTRSDNSFSGILVYNSF